MPSVSQNVVYNGALRIPNQVIQGQMPCVLQLIGVYKIDSFSLCYIFYTGRKSSTLMRIELSSFFEELARPDQHHSA